MTENKKAKSKNKELTKKEKERLHIQVLEKTVTLMSAGMGLVAALAWNEAIKKLFTRVFGEQSGGSIVAMFAYALIITIVVVLITVRLTRLIEKLKKGNKKE